MGYYTRAQLVTQLANVETAIEKALEAQSHTSVLGASIQRANLDALYRRRRELINDIEQLDATGSGDDAVGPQFHKVKFQRQT